PHHTPSPEVTLSHPSTSSILLPSIPTSPIPLVTKTVTTPILQNTRRARIAQSTALPTVADEPASPVRDDSQEEACPTDSGFIADQDRATIAKSSTLPRDSAPRVTSPAAEEGREAPAERISNDSEEIARVLTSIDAATVLVGEANVPTGSGFIPTAPPTATIVSTGSEKREYYMAVMKSYLGWRFKDFKGMSFEEIEAKSTQVWKRIEDFTPMGSKDEA
nr:hypothetical protein [Tanacetum cinerariifolium]